MSRWTEASLRWIIAVMCVALVSLSRAEGQTLAFNPGSVTSLAGNGTTSYSSASFAGPASSAGLNFPRRIAIDASGNLYWMEKGGNLARVMASGKGTIPALPSVASPTAGWVYTIAGNGGTTSCAAATDAFGDGCPATQATLNTPYGIAVDARGNVYLGDAGDFLVRVVYAGGSVPNLPPSPVAGDVYAVAGTGATGANGDGGPALSAQIAASHGLTVDARGNLYFVDSGNQSIRAVFVSGSLPGITNPQVGNLYTLAGGPVVGACAKATSACGDGGPALSAQINGPDSIGVDASGNLVFGDTGDLRLRAIYVGGTLAGVSAPVAGYMYTVAGNGVSGSGPDGVKATASSVTSGMGQPFIDSVGNIYLPDGGSNTVRKIDPAGTITTIAGGAAKVCAASKDSSGDGCAANQTTFNGVSGLVVDAASNVYLADYKNNLIRLLSPASSSLNFSGAIGLAIPSQTVLVSNASSQPLNVSGLTVSGPFAQVATGSSDCNSSTVLAPGATCGISIASQATTVGTGTGAVTIASNSLNAASGQNIVQLASVIGIGSTSTSVSVAPSLANFGQPVVLTAMITLPAGVTLSPGGMVTFLSGTTAIGSASVSGGLASFTTGSLPAGTYSITAAYSGDANFAASTSAPATLTVSSTMVPAVTLTGSAASVVAGQPLSLTATVTPYSGSKVPTGSVTFSDGSNVLGQSSLNAAGVATLVSSALGIGNDNVVASYAGDANFVSVASAPLTVQVLASGQLTLLPGKLVTIAGSHALGSGFSGDGGLATAAQIKTPLGMAFDAAGNLFFADSANNRIRRIDAVSGTISTIAGTGVACATAALPCGDGGQATAALLNGPQGVRVDPSGNIYILDKGDHAVRKIAASTGVITTVAGTLTVAGNSGDGGAATAAKLNGPRGMFLDNGNNLFLADSGNALVRRVDAVSGTIATVAGSGSSLGDGGLATAAQLVNPRGISIDGAGNLLIADIGAYRVRRVDAKTGMISTFAGTGAACGAPPCGDGSVATSATFSGPQDVVATPSGEVWITDPGLNAVRRVSAAGLISTLVGTQSTTAGYAADGGAATSGLLSYPNSLLFDPAGNLYVSEANNSLVREVLAGSSAFNFGSLTLGTTAAQTAVLASTGNQPITLSSITLPAGYLQQPSGSADCAAGLTLNAGASCVLQVEFAPLVAGSFTGTVTVVSNAGNVPGGATTLSVTGTGTASTGTTAQTIAFPAPGNVVYGAAPVALGGTATSGLAVTYGSISGPAVLNGSSLKIIGTGQVSVTAYQFGNGTFAAATPVTQTFQVAPATLQVTAMNASRAVGVANPVFTFSVTGFVAGDSQAVLSGMPALTTSATVASPAGSYPIVISAGTLAAANYTFTFVNGTLTVLGQAQTISFGPISNVPYGSLPIKLGAVSNSGLPISYAVSGPASLSGSMLAITGAGSVTVTASQAGNGSFAAAVPVSQMFQVLPAALTVTAANASRAINTANPAFTASYSGFVNGDSSVAITGAPNFSTTATLQSPLGSYPITVTQGTLQAANYTFQFVNGVLTVTPPPPDFSLSSNLSGLTLDRGVTGHVTLSLTPISNYAGTVSLACGPLPAGASCSFAPSTVTLDGSGTPATAVLTITTGGQVASLDSESMKWGRQLQTVSLCLLPGIFIFFRRDHLRRGLGVARGLLTTVMLFALGLAFFAGLSGCGSSESYVAPVVTTITVTGTATQGGNTLTHALSLNLSLL